MIYPWYSAGVILHPEPVFSLEDLGNDRPNWQGNLLRGEEAWAKILAWIKRTDAGVLFPDGPGFMLTTYRSGGNYSGVAYSLSATDTRP